MPTVRELEWFGAHGELRQQPDYMRYWHGYAVFTRPALANFGLSGARWLAFGLLAASIGVFTRSVSRRSGGVAAVLVVAPGLLTTDMILGGLSISHAIGLATAWVGGRFVLDQASKERSPAVAGLAAVLGGALNADFDLMVAIPASLALCVVAAGLGAMSPGERVARSRTAHLMLAAMGGWAVGLAGMWASKWVLACCSSIANGSSTAFATRSSSAPVATSRGSRETASRASPRILPPGSTNHSRRW